MPDPVETVIRLMASRRLKAVPPLPALDGRAFELAREEFGHAYANALPAPAYRDVQAHDEALAEALMAAIGMYVREAAR